MTLSAAEVYEKYFDILNSTALFSCFTPNECEEAFALFDAETLIFKKGEYLFRAGDRISKFGLVLSGKIQVCADDIEGNRMIMANVTPGGTFGESLCFLKVMESPCYIFAAENSVVMKLSPDRLFTAGDGVLCLKLGKRFTSMLAARTLQMNSRIQILSKLSLRKKLITYFSELSRENRSNTFSIQLNRNDMASYIGTDRSALSRELSRMKKEGLIDYYKDTVRIFPEKTNKG